MKLISQFVGGVTLSSRIIELAGAGFYSHVDIVLLDGRLLGARSDEVGGAPPGVQIRLPNYEEWDHVAQIAIEVSIDQYDHAMFFLNAQLRKPYDHSAIAAFIFGRDWQEEDSWFCSELCMAAHEAAGGIFEHPLATSDNKISPSTAFAILSTYGEVRLLR